MDSSNYTIWAEESKIVKSNPSDQRVLWVEDILLSVRANVSRFDRAGFKVDIARSLTEAEAMARVTKYQFIFVDFSIPLRNEGVAETSSGLGVEFLKKLKSERYGALNADVLSFLCTAHRESLTNEDQIYLDRNKIDIIAKAGSYKTVQGLTELLDGEDDD